MRLGVSETGAFEESPYITILLNLLMLHTLNTVLHIAVIPNHKVIFNATAFYCNSATVTECNINMFSDSLRQPLGRGHLTPTLRTSALQPSKQVTRWGASTGNESWWGNLPEGHSLGNDSFTSFLFSLSLWPPPSGCIVGGDGL